MLEIERATGLHVRTQLIVRINWQIKRKWQWYDAGRIIDKNISWLWRRLVTSRVCAPAYLKEGKKNKWPTQKMKLKHEKKIDVYMRKMKLRDWRRERKKSIYKENFDLINAITNESHTNSSFSINACSSCHWKSTTKSNLNYTNNTEFVHMNWIESKYSTIHT